MNKLKNFALLAALLFLLPRIGLSNDNDSSLLWKVSGNGLEKPSYLFGTHHLVPISFIDSVAGINSAFNSTEQTVSEIEMAKMSKMQMQMKLMKKAIMPKGIKYESLLPAEDLALIDSTLKSLVGVGLKQLGKLKPAMLSNMISVTLYQRYYPELSTTISLDEHFQKEAVKQGRSVVELDTFDEQIELLLNSQDTERQAELLLCMVKHPEVLKEQLNKLHSAYYEQNLRKLYELSEEELPNDPCPSTEEEKNQINSDRNLKWLKKLPSIIMDKPSFIAVGCLHLPGEDGLIEGLRRLGFTVEPVIH